MKFSVLPVNSFYKDILKLALPAIGGLSTQMILSLVDSAIVGRLGEAQEALAAMGVGVLITWAIVSFFSSLSVGTHVFVAQRFGRKDYKFCGVILNNSMVLGLVLGTVVAAITMYFSYEIAYFFASDYKVAHYASEFLFYRFLGIPFFLLTVSYRGFYFGISKVKIFLIAGLLANLLNIFFNYVLVFGKFGIPGMGVGGSGLGSTLATLCEFLVYFIVSLMPSYSKKFDYFKNFKIDLKLIKQIFKISLPVSFQNVFVLLGFASFMGIVGLLGTLQQGASQTVISSMFLSLLPCFGFGIAVQTLVGNNLGSGKIALAKIYAYEAAKIATYYTTFLGLIFVFVPEAILWLITEDQTLIETAKPALRIAGFTQIFYATGVVLANGLQAGGKTMYVMLSEAVTNLLIFVPMAYFLGKFLGLGLLGAWAALPFYVILYSTIILLKFRKEKFLDKVS